MKLLKQTSKSGDFNTADILHVLLNSLIAAGIASLAFWIDGLSSIDTHANPRLATQIGLAVAILKIVQYLVSDHSK